jgi:hypothetical protein
MSASPSRGESARFALPLSRELGVGSITYSIAARSSTLAVIANMSECTGSVLGAASSRCEVGGGDFECGMVIGAGGAKGEGEMDDVEADAATSGLGTGHCCNCDAAVDGDLDL